MDTNLDKMIAKREQTVLDGKLSPILVFAVAGHLGSGTSFVAKALIEELKGYNYQSTIVKVTSHILDEYKFQNPLPEVCEKISEKAKQVRTRQLQGNAIREIFKTGKILGALCAEKIFMGVDETTNCEFDIMERHAYVIDSLKHPEEYEVLRTVFQDAFCMIGVVASPSTRRERLIDQKSITDTDLKVLIEDDEKEACGQQVTKTLLKADYFFENNFDTPQKINQECKRLLNLIFQSTITTPRLDEVGMHLAYMAADRSACLSRQVGAAILNERGDVIATGSNDVPRFGGGLYTSETAEDKRCYAMSGLCHNDQEKQNIADEIFEELSNSFNSEVFNENRKEVTKILLKNTRLKQLIEFSRAVHAEMDAIMSVARSATPGIIGSTMYVTTYPCHNCAKHIIDAGIRRVIYLEPYEKSLAPKLHKDSIRQALEDDCGKKVTFDGYSGIAPSRYTQYFSMRPDDRKSESKLIPWWHNKRGLLPLGAQEEDALTSRISQIKKWLESVRAKVVTAPEATSQDVPCTAETVT